MMTIFYLTTVHCMGEFKTHLLTGNIYIHKFPYQEGTYMKPNLESYSTIH